MNLVGKLCFLWVLYQSHKKRHFVLSPLEGVLLLVVVGLSLGKASFWTF